MNSITVDNIQNLLLTINNQKVLLDRDVATIYGVETKRVNEAVKNNPERFPTGYILEVNEEIKKELVENFDRFSTLKHATTTPKAFTEKGIYMLATILTSKKAIQTTIEIIETFAKIKELSHNIQTLSAATDKTEQQNIMQKSGEILAELLDDDLQTSEAETTIELNFAVLKFKHTIKKKKND